MSSIEALAMGVPVVTNVPPQMTSRIGAHPFVQADASSVETILESLITNVSRCRELSREGQRWVRERHDVRTVGDQLYSYYRRMGWIENSHT